MFVSIRGRVLINIEALNMTESVGNYVKHRRVPVVIHEMGYTTYFVPAISGECISHGYQSTLSETAKSMKLPICKLCEKGIFLKSTNTAVLADSFREKLANLKKKFSTEEELERFIISNCVVEDVGGFLFAPEERAKISGQDKEILEKVGILQKDESKKSNGGGSEKNKTISNLKRTSNFYTGYMIPVKEALQNVIIEPQLHSRYALGTPFVKKEQRGQMLYYVEISSAPYTFSFDLDTKFIGKPTFYYKSSEDIVLTDKVERVKASLQAIASFLREVLFGAKKTRFLPIVDWESIAISISDDVWTVPSSMGKNYLKNLLSKVERNCKDGLKVFVYINPEFMEDTETYVKKKTSEIIEILKKVLEEWKMEIKKIPELEDKINLETIVKEKIERLISANMDDLISGSSLRYSSSVKKAYEEFLNGIKERNLKEKILVYNSFDEAVTSAISEAEKKCSGT